MQQKRITILRMLCIGVIFCSILIVTVYVFSGKNSTIPVDTSTDFSISDVIPDKYNTGIEAGHLLTPMSQEPALPQLHITDSGDRWKLDFRYGNTQLEDGDIVVIEGIDFSEKTLACQNEGSEKQIKVIFRNCKFASFSCGRAESKVHYIFDHCEIGRFYGSNSDLVYCKLGGSIKDAVNPFVNVSVLNSFICDMAHYVEGAGEHTDGIQIYGAEGVDVHDILIANCRFEIPAIPMSENNSYVNACIFIGLEFSNGNTITVKDCIMNGGGFCIYANAKAPYLLRDVVLENIRVGTSHRYGIGFDKIVQGTEYTNISYLDALYVASVWQKDGKIYLSVTNDTNRERVLKICTDSGEFSFIVPRCPAYDEIVVDSMSYEDFPFDILYTVDGSEWVKCYDITEGEEKEIRFEEW